MESFFFTDDRILDRTLTSLKYSGLLVLGYLVILGIWCTFWMCLWFKDKRNALVLYRLSSHRMRRSSVKYTYMITSKNIIKVSFF